MKYVKGQDARIDNEYKNSAMHSMRVKLSDEVLFYKKMFHWEYVLHEEISRIHRKVEEVVSHTSCCAENMDIDRLIITKKDGEVIDVHVCDGERRVAERLYDDLKKNWTDVSFGT